MLALFIILALAFLATTIFLGKEMMNKFGLMQNFISSSNQMLTWHYQGEQKLGMRNIVLRGEKPFAVLIGFRLKILTKEGFDYYGYVHSDKMGVVVISTYLGKGPCEFQFFTNTDLNTNMILVSSTEVDQMHKPMAIYPPHWWQRLGFWG